MFKANLKVVEAEIQVAIKLGSVSKYLVQLIEYFIEDNCFCLVMEFCSGGNLQKIFNEKNQIPQPVLNFSFLQIFLSHYIGTCKNSKQCYEWA
jgi:serine/threonine protein kinase